MMRLKTSHASPSVGTKRSCSRITRCAISVIAIAVIGVTRLGFQIIASPQTAASIAFHAQTAAGKLNAVMMPIVPIGCHCSYIRCSARSLCIVRPCNCRDSPTAKSAMSTHS